MSTFLIDSIEVYAEKLMLKNLPSVVDMANSITYVSIGCAYNDGQQMWTPENDQQYPIFIRNFKKYHDEILINLILIDPNIGIIPCLNNGVEVIRFARYNKQTYIKSKNIYETYEICYNNVYECKNNIKIFTMNNSVAYTPHLMTDIGQTMQPSEEFDTTILKRQQVKQFNIDITSMLEHLNKKCLKENGILIVHDFSGMDIWILDKYFSNYTDVHSDKIIYDLSDGTQNGCFLDMSDEKNHIYFEIKNGHIFMDNVKKISPHVINFALQDSNKYPKQVISKLLRIKEKLLTDFIIYVNNYRKALLWKIGIETNYDIDIKKRSIYKRELIILDLIHHTHLVDIYSQNNVIEFIRIMKELFEIKKSELESVYNIKINFPDKEPNTWAPEIDRILHCIKNE